MKKRIALFFTVIVMAFCLTGCGGGKEIVEETAVETKEIGCFYTNGEGYLTDKVYEEILSSMESSDAQFFYIEHDENWSEHKVFQTNMETYNEIAKGIPDASSSSKSISKGLNHFANLTDKKVVSDPNTWFDGMDGNRDGISLIFGGTISDSEETISTNTLYTYFKDNEIKLSSPGIEVTKIGIMYDGKMDSGADNYMFFFIGKGDICVENKANDPQKVFSPINETQTYTLKGYGSVSTEYTYLGLDRIFIKYQ